MQKKLYPQIPKKTNGDCPTCGFHISHSSSFDGVLAGQFDNTREGSYVATRVTPVRASTLEADVLVPAAQSAIWALVSALPAVAVSYGMRYEWYFPFAVSSVALLISWLSAMKRSDRAQAKLEEFSYYTNETERGRTGQVTSAASVTLEVTDKSENYGVSLKIVQLPAGISEADWDSFCNDILAGRSLARSNWAGSGKLFSRDLYDQLMVNMEEAGLIASVAGKGRRLTAGGKGAIKAMIRTRGIMEG